MNGKIDVAAIGEVLIDFAQESVDALGYPTMAAHPGGAPCNFLAALSALGMKTAFLGKVGEDDFGLMLRHTLEAAGIDTRGLISDPDVFTTLAFVRFDENRDRSFSFARKPGADTRLRSDELDLTVIDECRMLHFGTLSLTDEPARSAMQARSVNPWEYIDTYFRRSIESPTVFSCFQHAEIRADFSIFST